MILVKLQFRFIKSEKLRYLSHRDILRIFQKALAEADLVPPDAGPDRGREDGARLVLPHALEIGAASLDEAIEIELARWVPPAEAASRLRHALPEGIEIKRVRLVPPSRQGGRVTGAAYRLDLAAGGWGLDPAALERFLAAENATVERVRKGRARPFDVRPYVRELRLEGPTLVMKLAAVGGTLARPYEVLAALSGKHLEAARNVPVTRTALRLAYG